MLLPSPTFIPGASTSKNSSLPRFTRLELTTLGASVSVVNVFAGTGSVIFFVPSNSMVLIFGGTCNLVAVAEFPENVLPVIVSA